MAASMVGCIHTHLRNAVPLVWGSLRLAQLCPVKVMGYMMECSQQSSLVPRCGNEAINSHVYCFKKLEVDLIQECHLSCSLDPSASDQKMEPGKVWE